MVPVPVSWREKLDKKKAGELVYFLDSFSNCSAFQVGNELRATSNVCTILFAHFLQCLFAGGKCNSKAQNSTKWPSAILERRAKFHHFLITISELLLASRRLPLVALSCVSQLAGHFERETSLPADKRAANCTQSEGAPF